MNMMVSNRKEIRQKDRMDILEILRREGPVSRVDLSRQLHIAKASVTAVVAEMMEAGELVERGGSEEAAGVRQRGRHKVMLDINENHKLALGASLDGQTLKVGLVNLKGQTLDHRETSMVEADYYHILEGILQFVDELIRDNCISAEKLLGLGVCVSESCMDRMDAAEDEEGLARLRRDLTYSLTLPIVTGKISEGALLAQKYFAKAAMQNLLMLRLGEDSESALMIGGKLFFGRHRRAGGGSLFGSLSAESALEKVVQALRLCEQVLDIGDVCLFGNYMQHSGIYERLAELLPDLTLHRGFVSEERSYLCGCAEVVGEQFFEKIV